MIRRLTYKILLLVACSALFAGCEQGFVGEWFDEPSGVESGDASLTITIAAPADDNTRAVAAEGSAAAGDKMNKLLALLVSGDKKIVARQVVVDTASGFTDATNKKAVVTFDNLAVATYSVYLIANYESVSTVNWANYTVGASVGATLTDALVGATLTGTATPSFETYGMPMTAKLTATLQHGTNAVSAEVERVVGRFGVSVYNHVVGDGYKVVVSDIELSSFNASNTYLFNHPNELPTSAKPYRKFFESATESTSVPVNKSTPFDQYVYETDANATYNLSFAVGVFQGLAAGVTPTITSMADAPSTENHNEIILGHKYLLYNADKDRYLYMNGNNLALCEPKYVPSENYNNYLWEFSTTDAGKIKNVGRNRWISRNNATLQTTESEASAETFTRGTYGSSMFLRSSYTTSETTGSWWNQTTTNYSYFLQAPDNNTISLLKGDGNATTTKSEEALWVLREMTTTPTWSINDTRLKASVYHSAPLTYDDEGYVKPLKQIKRNQNIQVGVNLFYNPEDGYFNFEVETWEDKTVGNVTFD